jgi:hypothetical protein
MPNGSWHYEFIAYISTEAQQEWQQAEGRLFSRQECRQAAKFTRTFWWEIGQFFAAASEPSKDHQGQESVLLNTDHRWQKILFRDPEVLLAAELGSWPCRLQEQARGASARAPSRWGAQSGHRQRPHQLEDVELDGSNKAEAACQVKASSKPTSIPMLGMSFPRLPFLIGIAVPPRRLKLFRWEWEMGPRETTRKNKISFYRTSTYVIGNMPSTDVLRNESKRIILLIIWNVIGQEVLANFVVK